MKKRKKSFFRFGCENVLIIFVRVLRYVHSFVNYLKCPFCNIQGCLMAFIETKNPNLGKFQRALNGEY
jgi:hypothetical protein